MCEYHWKFPLSIIIITRWTWRLVLTGVIIVGLHFDSSCYILIRVCLAYNWLISRKTLRCGVVRTTLVRWKCKSFQIVNRTKSAMFFSFVRLIILFSNYLQIELVVQIQKHMNTGNTRDIFWTRKILHTICTVSYRVSPGL